MSQKPSEGAPGTTGQSPRWEGPKQNRPRGYLPAKDDPDRDRDAADENNQDPEKSDLGDLAETRNTGRKDHLPTPGGDNPNVRFLTENTDLSPRQARELIDKHGNDRARLLEIARTMKAEG